MNVLTNIKSSYVQYDFWRHIRTIRTLAQAEVDVASMQMMSCSNYLNTR